MNSSALNFSASGARLCRGQGSAFPSLRKAAASPQVSMIRESTLAQAARSIALEELLRKR
jgi:hypothetical protein